MGVRDVRRKDAVRFGLLERAQRLDPVLEEFDLGNHIRLVGVGHTNIHVKGLDRVCDYIARSSFIDSKLFMIPPPGKRPRHRGTTSRGHPSSL